MHLLTSIHGRNLIYNGRLKNITNILTFKRTPSHQSQQKNCYHNLTKNIDNNIFNNKFYTNYSINNLNKLNQKRYELYAITNILYNRLFSSNKSSNDGNDGTGNVTDEPATTSTSSETNNEYTQSTHLPATVAIPEVWPHLPVIATRRNPVFPRFMKIVEV